MNHKNYEAILTDDDENDDGNGEEHYSHQRQFPFRIVPNNSFTRPQYRNMFKDLNLNLIFSPKTSGANEMTGNSLTSSSVLLNNRVIRMSPHQHMNDENKFKTNDNLEKTVTTTSSLQSSTLLTSSLKDMDFLKFFSSTLQTAIEQWKSFKRKDPDDEDPPKDLDLNVSNSPLPVKVDNNPTVQQLSTKQKSQISISVVKNFDPKINTCIFESVPLSVKDDRILSKNIEDSGVNQNEPPTEKEKQLQHFLKKNNSTLSSSSRSNFTSNKRIRVSDSGPIVQNILDQKRALREKNLKKQDDLNKKQEHQQKSGDVGAISGRRLFGKAFSPTPYSPEKPIMPTVPMNNIISKLFQHDKDRFILTLLSIDFSIFLSSNDSFEDRLMPYIEQVHRKFDPKFQWSDETMLEMKLEFEDFRHYKMLHTIMLLLDTLAQITTGSSNSNMESSPEVLMIKTISFVEEEHFMNLFFKCVFSNTEILQDRHQFENWIVRIKSKNQNTQSKKNPQVFFHGFVTEVFTENSTKNLPRTNAQQQQKIRYSIKISKEVFQHKWSSTFSDQTEFLIKPIYYLKPTLRLVETMSHLEFYRPQFFRSIIKPCYEDCSFQTKVPSQYQFKFHDGSLYNSNQQATIKAAFNTVQLPFNTNKILLVQGPPGTGKTHTLIGVIKNIFSNLIKSVDKEKPLRILVCAPSNGAIDEIGRRLVRERKFLRQYRENKSLRILRIGQKQQIHHDLAMYGLDQMIDYNLSLAMTRQQQQQQQAGSDSGDLILKRSNVRDEIIRNADIILSTLSSSQQSALDMFRSDTRSSKNAIRCLIVDEASQCVEPELLMPLIYNSITKMILIGDPLQLPATVISKKAQQLNFGRSLFERFYLYFQKTNTHRLSPFPIIRLTKQFRMHPEICSFPSEHFYDGMLETDPCAGQHPSIKMHPYFVFDVLDSQESYNRKCKSLTKSNDAEVEFICKLFQQILNKIGYSNKSSVPPSATIGVITFYRGQKHAIMEQFQKRFSKEILKHVEVNTVDAFQGQERDIIILSCVRAFESTVVASSHSQSIGFLRSQQRMNVALTRARSLLCICLHRKSFENVPRWQQLLLDAQRRNRLFPVSSKILDELQFLLI